MLWTLWGDEDGLTTVEYALLLAMIVVVAIATWQVIGTKINDMVESAESEMQPYGG